MAAIATAFQPSSDPTGVDAWLARLPNDAPAAFSLLRQQAHALASEPIATDQRYAMLERVRDRALGFVAAQRARYLGRPVPLAQAERAAWEDHVGLWQAFYFGYALCTDAGVEPRFAAAVWQRALDSLGRAMREYVCAYRAVPASLWQEFNRCYRSAEDCALSEIEIADTERPDDDGATCKTAYLATLLYESANLYSVSGAQMQLLELWLPDWLGLVDLAPSAPEDSARSPLAIDLAGDSGARRARDFAPADTLRYLDTSALALKLRDLGASVRAGADIGGTLPRPLVERLLTHLYVQWCSVGSGRIDERRDAATRAQVAVNMHAVHFQISGRAFRQPGLRYTREEEHDLATFGHITERTEHRLLTGRSSALEPWEIVNQSASGLLGMCRKPDLETCIAHGQLIAMRTSSIAPPVLGVVQRLRLEHDGALNVGVRAIRGEARGAAVRRKGDPALKYERALLVDADPERRTPAFLIVPPATFAAGSALELFTSRAETVTVSEILDQGADHERVAFAPG